MLILSRTLIGSPLGFAGDKPIPMSALTNRMSKVKLSAGQLIDTFQQGPSHQSPNQKAKTPQTSPVRLDLQSLGDKALQEFEARKKFYTDVLINKIPQFREKCNKLNLNVQEEAEAIAEKRANKETKWPAFPDWDFESKG